MITLKALTNYYTGVTDELRFVTLHDLTVTKKDTLIAVVTCHSTGLNPTIPSDWTKITSVDSTSGSTFIFMHQPTGTTIGPTYSVSGLGTSLHCGFVTILNGCYYLPNDVKNVVDDYTTQVSTGTIATMSNSYTTTVKNTFMLNYVNFLINVSTDDETWKCVPSLTFTERMDNGKTESSQTVHISMATTPLVPINTYGSFEVNFTPATSNEYMFLSLSLIPELGNKVQAMCTL
jgi:hypothetical protein